MTASKPGSNSQHSQPQKHKGPYDYQAALCRDLPESFAHALTIHEKDKDHPISLPRAKMEHSHYTEMLKTLVPRVVSLPADQNCPDCCFVEDVLVVVPPFTPSQQSQQQQGAQEFPGLAIITRPGAASRQPEVAPIRSALLELGCPPKAICELKAPATLDGGDVMFTGHELWVGLSHRTNQAAIDQLRSLLGPACPVYSISMEAAGRTALHLKSVASVLDETTLLRADTPAGHSIEAQANADPRLAGRFKFVAVPDPLCSNVLRIGKNVVMQYGYPKSEEVIKRLCQSKGLSLNTVRMGECAKADGALTCCSVLIHLPKPRK